MRGPCDLENASQVPEESAIVRPPRPHTPSPIGPLTLMVATAGDCRRMRERLRLSGEAGQSLYLSRFVAGAESGGGFNLVGPLLGAPMAAMLLETLAAWGAQRVVFWGWCGALAPGIESGEIITPCGAIIDEGTSRHYGATAPRVGHPTPDLQAALNAHLVRQGLACRDGWVWTTDAVFRETPGKIKHYQAQGALAVEMELSAIFTLGHALSLEVAAVLIVSDELSTGQWRPGFKTVRFREARRLVCAALHQYALEAGAGTVSA